jgi:SanA protein
MRRWAVRALLAVALLVALAAAGAWIFMEQSAGGRISASLDALEPADAGLVLGSSRLVRGGYSNPYFTKRIAAAAALFASGKVKYLIVSGNQADGGRAAGGYDEPTDMRDALVAAGVPENRIYRDYAGFRTLDSVLRAKAIFGQDRVILVSQHFHLVRALFLAAEHGLDFEGFEAEDAPLRYGVTTRIREAGARLQALVDIVDRRAAHFGGEPVRLGIDPPT